MTTASWAALLIAWFAAIALPGPDVFLLLRLGVRSRRAAVLAAVGIMSGNLIWVTVSVLGLTAVLRAFPMILPVMQIFGVVILTTLGVQSIRSGVSQLRGTAHDANGRGSKNPWLLGFITNLANPKALIFFTALLSQFIPADSSWSIGFTIIIVMTLTGLMWFVGVAVGSSSMVFRRWFGRAAPWFDISAGIVFVVVALAIAVEVLVTWWSASIAA